jgi:hypothetical protein
MRKMLIALCLTLMPLVLLSACRPASAPASAPTPQPAPALPMPPENQPSQSELNFHISSTATPGDTDKYGSHSFALRLEANQRLSITFKAVGGKVLVSIYTPAKETWGYNPSSKASPEMGVMTLSRQIRSEEGSATFTATDTGNYVITVKSSSPVAEIDVTMTYNIQPAAV